MVRKEKGRKESRRKRGKGRGPTRRGLGRPLPGGPNGDLKGKQAGEHRQGDPEVRSFKKTWGSIARGRRDKGLVFGEVMISGVRC